MKLFFASIGLLIVVMSGFLLWSSLPQSASAPTVPIAGVEKYAYTDRSHTAEKVTYAEVPPVGGSHAPTWVACNGNVYDKPVLNEQAVHSLEHGAVWITYQPSLDATQRESLAQKVRTRTYTFMSPLAEQRSPIILSAWNTQLAVQSANDPHIDQFLKAFSQGPQTPEPGASCAADDEMR